MILDLLALTSGATCRPIAPRVPPFSWVAACATQYGWSDAASLAADAGYRSHFLDYRRHDR